MADAPAYESKAYPALLERQAEISERLQVIGIDDASSKRKPIKPKKSSSAGSAGAVGIPFTPKTDTHWDFVMKEMMWLGADFQAERKRQLSLAKKCAASVKQYHKTKETRRLRELAQAETKRRKLAAKIGRDLRGWWTKIEKVIAYKQKLDADEERKKAMNKQLVVLVQKTERYSESLAMQTETDEDDESSVGSTNDDMSTSDNNSDVDVNIRAGRKRRRRLRMTIEEALASQGIRKSKKKIIDYARLRVEDKLFYGETTASDSGSDASYTPESDTDDETTLKEAIHDEILERKQHDPSYPSNETFLADPEELRKLHEESAMEVDVVLERLRLEGEAPEVIKSQPIAANSEKRVQFLETATDPVVVKSEENHNKKVDPGEDADDDADASDVEDYDNGNNSGNSDDEFEAEEPEADDETTIAQEELLPKELNPQQEIDLLKKESEMPIKELRNLYANLDPAIIPTGPSVPEDDNDSNNGSKARLQAMMKPALQAGDDSIKPFGTEASTDNQESPHSNNSTERKEYDPQAMDVDDESPKVDEEFQPLTIAEVDDETTLEAEENLGREMSHEEEMALLQKDNEIPIEQLRAMYANIQNTANNNDEEKEDIDMEDQLSNSSATDDLNTKTTMAEELTGPMSEGEGDGAEEFQPNEFEAVDDETTLEAEERLGREMSHEEEMEILRKESEIPIEQLRAQYAAMNNKDTSDYGSSHRYSANSDSSEDEARATTADIMGTVGNIDEDLEDYRPNDIEVVDDETTLEAEERLAREMSYEEEMALLKSEGEIPIEQLRAIYANLTDDQDEDSELEPPEPIASDEETKPSINTLFGDSVDGDGEGEEFKPNETEAVDDETTMEAEERMGRDMSYEDEIALLKRESELSVDELRAKYAMLNEESEEDSHNTDDEKTADIDDRDSQEHDTDKAKNGDKRSKRKQQVEEANVVKRAKQVPSGEGSDDGLAALSALEASAERARRTLTTRPFLLAGWVKLRRYQHVGLNWLVSLQSKRLNGILADEMGLGKTLQTIALLSYLASYKGIWGPHLVVVPTSVIINWETELKRFCPALKVLCYYGSAKRRKELRTGWTKTNWYHVVITSYQLAVQDAFAFKRKRWYYLILDEAQNIKNFQSQRWQTLINFNSQRRLLLTGTPLQNNLMELWSLLHFLMPFIFRSRKEFSYWFSNPMNSMIDGSSDRNDDVIKRLHGIIRPFILRRLKKDVETQMPGKFEHIVKCQLSRRQMMLYEEFLSRSSTRQALKKGGNFMGMMTVLMQLRKVCNHPDLFEPRSVVTPFVVPSLSYVVPSCIYDAHNCSSATDNLSINLLQPLWCGSEGLPSVGAALRHDKIAKEQLRRLKATYDKESLLFQDESEDGECPQELQTLVSAIHELRRKEKMSKIDFHNQINDRRCQATEFAYSSQLLGAVEAEVDIFRRTYPVELHGKDIFLTPSQLLALRKTEQVRADDMEEMIDKFAFRVPRAGARAPILDTGYAQDLTVPTKNVEDMLHEPLEECLRPYRKARARLSSFFPDKKLVQFDAGKLQALAELLFKLKKGGHRALIFTQMSKMLDILEAFLNINGHTYLRLDGATGVERRQRFMDRFNNDTRIFCFILSTRSGGMGINLTGADTVIFYDSDWNPAMDAQAQDRAHRIGQTRDVHIYRLITENSVEENILMKAKQKRNLDIMVMDQGKFDASQLSGQNEESVSGEMKDVYSKGGLRAILGVTDDDGNNKESDQNKEASDTKDSADLSNEQMETAMAALEDEDDVKALRGAQKEAAEDLKEFDESVEITKNSDAEDDEVETGDGDETAKKPKKKQNSTQDKLAKDTSPKTQEGEEAKKNEESELEKEFASWQTTVGFDASAIESSLSPTERYALSFREEIDPFYSIFLINELRRKAEATQVEDEIDMDEIEREKAYEERRAMDDGDLLGTCPRPEDLIRQRNQYRRERARLRAEKKRRKLTGENWSSKIDGLTQKPFWYNADTGEAIWDKPAVLLELEADQLAQQKGWAVLPVKPLVHVMEFLTPLPDRQSCSAVCRQWKVGATAFKFVRHVYPVEMGALNRDPSRMDYNHCCSIEESLSVALPGDTIELADGHYWVQGNGLVFDKPLKLIGDEHNPANVVIEMTGSVKWTGKGGWIEGITFRRPKISSGEIPSSVMLDIGGAGKVDVVHSVFDNDGSSGAVVVASGSGPKGHWHDVVVRNGGSSGIQLEGEVSLSLTKSRIRGNGGNGLKCSRKGNFSLVDSRVEINGGFGVECKEASSGIIQKCRFLDNKAGILRKESGCIVSCSGNTALVVSPPTKQVPGFRITTVASNTSNLLNSPNLKVARVAPLSS